MSRGNTPWINEGPLRVRFRQEGNHLVKEMNQPDRNLIMDTIQEEKRVAPRQSFLGGYKVGSIPLVDWEIVKKKHPGPDCNDAEERRKALIRFSNDPDMKQYITKKA